MCEGHDVLPRCPLRKGPVAVSLFGNCPSCTATSPNVLSSWGGWGTSCWRQGYKASHLRSTENNSDGLISPQSSLSDLFHPRVPCRISQDHNTTWLLSLPNSAFISFFPQVLTPKTVLYNKLHLRIHHKTQPLIFIPIQWTNSGKKMDICYFCHQMKLTKYVFILEKKKKNY